MTFADFQIHNLYGQAVVALVFQLGNSLVER